jgi:peptidyl-prolyl cis-trans isomerase B (cyclophilin B)
MGMRLHCEAIITSLTAFTLLALAGCGGKGDGTEPRAAISGAGGPSTSQDLLHPVVVLDTSLGSITVRLDKEKAPLTVDNFFCYSDSGHYDQTIFHQVFKGQGILGGGYTTALAEKPAHTPIRNEADNGLKNRRGTIAMVRAVDSIDSATSHFLFNVADNAILDHQDRTPQGYGYCVFGDVVAGMDVIDNIAETPVQDTPQMERTPVQAVLIKSIRRK